MTNLNSILKSRDFTLPTKIHLVKAMVFPVVMYGWTLASKVMSLLLKILSRLVMTFLTRSTCLLVSWLQSPSAVILEPPKYSLTLFPHLFPMK